MTVKAFADTNIAGYLLSNDERKRDIAKQIIGAGPVMSTQVINEFINLCLKKARLNLAQTHLLANSPMKVCPIVPVDIETVRQAMRLSQRYQFSHWDSL
jgi:predicted nucleic acid-binding protein